MHQNKNHNKINAVTRRVNVKPSSGKGWGKSNPQLGKKRGVLKRHATSWKLDNGREFQLRQTLGT